MSLFKLIPHNSEIVPARMGDVFFHHVFFRVERIDESDHYYDPSDASYYLDFDLSNVAIQDSIKVGMPCNWGTMPIYVSRYYIAGGKKFEITKQEIEHLKNYAFRFTRS
jgi:hypothetical protein